MATFIVSIEMDNDAFQPDPSLELRTLLLEIAERVRLYGPDCKTILDTNGNSVGFTDVWLTSRRTVMG
jgi:hypothetical protein